MMGEGLPASYVSVAEGKDDGMYPIYFGVSCAFVTLRLLSIMEKPDKDDGRWRTITDTMLQGSAQLLGLLVWKAQRGEGMEEKFELLDQLKKAEMEVVELRKMRTEDAKANEKVVGIFASQEQQWIGERKSLRLQIQALLRELQILERKKQEVISNLNERIEEKEQSLLSKDRDFEEEQKKREALEEKLKMAEEVTEELNETIKKEAQEHSSELWKHKTAFIELVSNQRQMEAEMGRALRQVEATRQDLDSVFEQKEEAVGMVRNLSMEIGKMQKDAEQKDKILHAMLRKSKLDAAEKLMLLKEVKILKSRRKQAELETERWKTLSEPRHDMHLRSNSSNRMNLRSEMFSDMKALNSTNTGCSQSCRAELQPASNVINPKTPLHEYLEADDDWAPKCITPKRLVTGKVESYSRYLAEGNRELVITADVKQMEDRVCLEAERYTSVLEQRHYAEIDAFVEQMRLKDEKLEAFHWRLLSMELESKRLQSQIEGLEEHLSRFKEDNIKLKALFSDREQELKSLKEKFSLQMHYFKKGSSNYYTKYPAVDVNSIWSDVKIIKKKLRKKEKEQKTNLVTFSREMDSEIQERDSRKSVVEGKLLQAALKYEKEPKEKVKKLVDLMRSRSTDYVQPYDKFEEHIPEEVHEEFGQELERKGNPIEDQAQISSAAQAPEEEIEEEKEVNIDPGHVQEEYVQNNCTEEAEVASKLASVENRLTKRDSPWKMDLHALGVSYKIKRLKHQLLMLEKIAVNQTSKDNSVHASESCDQSNMDDQGQQMRGFLPVMALLNKQVRRYQSLEEKTDDLCKRMHESNRVGKDRDSTIGRTKEESETLGHFLEETFQLQRYMVATGQKLVEILSRISSCLTGSTGGLNAPTGFDMKQFADNIGTLFRETQRGLEVRIARIIGDLEGTLACEGILHL